MIKKIFFLFFIFITVSYSTSDEVVKKKIDNILNSLPSSTKASVIVFNPFTEDTIFSLNANESRIPASNTKLFTTATALSIMGGDYTLSTKILADDSDLSDSTINGNLYIKGYGNSTFTEDDLDSLVNLLYQMGVRKITGNVIGDDSYFDNIYTRDDWIRDEVANVKLPPVSALVINRNKRIVYKRYRRRTRRYVVYIKDPPLYAADLLKAKLRKHLIKVEGDSQKGITPLNASTLVKSDIILRELIKLINKHSDNYLAECLFKTIGAVASGKQGNSFYATQAILNFIDDKGIYGEGTSVVDGSGISRYDQVTVRAIAGLLEKMYFDLSHFDDFYNSLSIAGVDGTLKHRLKNTQAENNFYGKTGTLNGVSSLSGYLKTSSGNELVICIIFEFKRGGASLHRRIQDEIIESLAKEY